MKSEESRAITAERLELWKERLAEGNGTPVCLIGVGHGSNSGTLILCIPEGMPNEQIATFLSSAAWSIMESRPPTSVPFPPKSRGKR